MRDLSKLNTEELKMVKRKVGVGFEKNRLQKGVVGFQYDKRQAFTAEISDNAWDDDDE